MIFLFPKKIFVQGLNHRQVTFALESDSIIKKKQTQFKCFALTYLTIYLIYI